ncbi:MAG: hypothetical protein HOV79_33820 [Hamadaea sp.]|nr:hypothetical protein [Hamadaea sp.]
MRPLLTPGWLAGHLLAVVFVLASGGLAWWQVDRAMGGNFLSYGYALFWPAFGVFVIVIWVREMRLALGRAPTTAAASKQPVKEGFGAPVVARAPVTAATAAAPGDDDVELAEYNRLLAWLAANPGARRQDYPQALLSREDRPLSA